MTCRVHACYCGSPALLCSSALRPGPLTAQPKAAVREEMDACGLLDLGPDELLEVLSSLRAPDLCSCALTCRALRDASGKVRFTRARLARAAELVLPAARMRRSITQVCMLQPSADSPACLRAGRPVDGVLREALQEQRRVPGARGGLPRAAAPLAWSGQREGAVQDGACNFYLQTIRQALRLQQSNERPGPARAHARVTACRAGAQVVTSPFGWPEGVWGELDADNPKGRLLYVRRPPHSRSSPPVAPRRSKPG